MMEELVKTTTEMEPRIRRQYKPRRPKTIPFLAKLVQLLTEEPELIQLIEGRIVIPEPRELEKKLPTYFRHTHYSSFQRQLNNFGYNKLHKSSSPTNSVYVKVKGDAMVVASDLLKLRPVLERSTELRRSGKREAGGSPTPIKYVSGSTPWTPDTPLENFAGGSPNIIMNGNHNGMMMTNNNMGNCNDAAGGPTLIDTASFLLELRKRPAEA
jgi:hypothetical protein